MTRDEVGEYVKNWLEDEYLDPKDKEVLTILLRNLYCIPDNNFFVSAEHACCYWDEEEHRCTMGEKWCPDNYYCRYFD